MMIEAIINGWWKVLALIAGAVAGIAAVIRILKKSGVDKVEAGPVKIDFEDKHDAS